jgi:hypothetical protein
MMVFEDSEDILPLSALVLELAGVASNVSSHASSIRHIRYTPVSAEDFLITYWTPRSPVLKTSSLFKAKHANISTLHRPKPLTATSFSISSSSLALTSICAVSSPLANFSASPEMYSALRCDSPAVRSVGRSLVRTWAGEGKEGCVSSKSAVNFFRMDAAA